MNATWHVTEVISMTDKITVKLVHPGQPLAVRMTWDGATRTYTYDGTNLRVEPRFHGGLVRALRNYFSTNQANE